MSNRGMMLIGMLMLLWATATMARPNSVQLVVDRQWAGCKKPCVRFVAPNSAGATLMVMLDRDEQASGVWRRALYLNYRGFDFTPVQLDTLKRLLVRDGFPTETDMRFVRYLRTNWFRTNGRETTHCVVVYLPVPGMSEPKARSSPAAK